MGESSKTIKSTGYAAYDSRGELKPMDFERGELGPNDVLIDIEYCGICHSDVHQVKSEWRDSTYPIVPGHEIIGKVAKTGTAVKKFKVGERAGVGCMVGSCGNCEACRNGFEYACMKGKTIWTYNSKDPRTGRSTYGGYSSNIIADQHFVLRIDPKVAPAGTAPLLCAGTTTYTPIMYWKVGPSTRVGIIGLGGLGHIAVKIASSLGAEVIVFTTSEAKAKDALRLGAADAVVMAKGKKSTKYLDSIDFLLDTASGKHDMNDYLSLLKLNGKLVIVGLPTEALSVEPFSLVHGHRVLAGSGLDGIKGTQEMLDYCARKGIVADIEKIPIQKVNEAYERIGKGDVKYRFVIDMSSLKNQK